MLCLFGSFIWFFWFYRDIKFKNQRICIFYRRDFFGCFICSFDEEGFSEIYTAHIKESVVKFSKISYECGLDGMVCSVYESLDIKNATSGDFLTLTPGIRPFGESNDDQKRVANLKQR